jgi:HlyD family secretion protein
MDRRSVAGSLLVLMLTGTIPLAPPIHPPLGGLLSPSAEAKNRALSLLDRLRRKNLPEGIVKTNGRIEATQVDVAAKYAGRLADVTVEEGSEVKSGEALGRISSPETEAQLRAAQANVERATQAMAETKSLIAERKAVLASARSDFERGQELIKGQIITQQTFDQRRRNYEVAEASVEGAIAKQDEAAASINNAKAEVDRLESMLHDLILVSPRTGRVQYQLARNGEVIAAGGKVLTILDLQDVYMTVFVPAAIAGKLQIGGEARIILDPAPQYVIPASVSFVAADAQFTPKTVETAEEREKLMFRVKLKVDPQLLKQHIQKVKTGIRGLGVVRTNVATAWPQELQVKLPQ